jgi:DNA-binding transcriptional regulator YiaG
LPVFNIISKLGDLVTLASGLHTVLCMTGDEIRRLRERLGLSQEQLAKKLGVHRNTVIKWEVKGNFTIESEQALKRLAEQG